MNPHVGDRVRFKKSAPLNYKRERAGKTGVVTAVVPDVPDHGAPLLEVRLDDGRTASGVQSDLVKTVHIGAAQLDGRSFRDEKGPILDPFFMAHGRGTGSGPSSSQS
jgi:hypothetical protein